MDQIIRIGMDTSQHVCQLHGVNAAKQPVLCKKMRRKGMVVFCEVSADHYCDRGLWCLASLGAVAGRARSRG